MKQTIFGNCPSKSNCYRVNPHTHGFFKTSELKAYEKSFELQCNVYRNKNISEPFEIEIDVYYPSQRSDLDNALKVILDCLQVCKAIVNDNKCMKLSARKFVDPKYPRIEFQLRILTNTLFQPI